VTSSVQREGEEDETGGDEQSLHDDGQPMDIAATWDGRKGIC
jgi:hypothetical protein